MGITGLLPFLKAIQREIHLSTFKGKKAAVDSYCWLHKGAYSCAMQIVMGTANLETLPFIRYCMKRVNLLRQYDITPIMVFDGGYLPTKANTEKERRERRQGYLSKGKQLLKDGRKSEANDCFQKCVDVSPAMALALIKACRKVGVECVVAPYEADAQLTYLQKENIVDFVITEDSDLLVFGCQRVFFKMDDSGKGKLIDLNDLGKANKGLVGFTQDSFRQMCIFSGCDYLPSVPGIGLSKALKLMRRCNQNPAQVIKTLQIETGKVPKNYEDDFHRAEYTFLYQLVFDPRTQRQVRLHQLPDDVDSKEFEFAGLEHSPKKAVHMARGNIDPITLKVLDSYSPSKAPPPKSTSWEASAMAGSNKTYPLSIQAKLPLVSTEKSKQPFKAPKRKLAAVEEEEEDSLGEQELCSMYTSASNPETKDSQTASDSVGFSKRSFSTSLANVELKSNSVEINQPVVQSRFFSSSSPETQSSMIEYSEDTPSENVLLLQNSNPVRRVIINYTSDTENDSELSTGCDPTADSKLYSAKQDSLKSVKKQLFGFAYRSERQNSLPKRLRLDTDTEQLKETPKHPFALLEESSPIVPEKPRTLSSNETSINPFSVLRQSPKTPPSKSLVVAENVRPNILDETETAVIENSSLMGHVDSTPLVSIEAESFKYQRDSIVDTKTTTNFMTSGDFINPHPSLKLDKSSSTCSELSFNPHVDEPSLSQSEQSEAVLTSRSKSLDLGCSNSAGTQGGWISTRRKSLAPLKGGKSRIKSVGLSKSSSRSKFKPPRSVNIDPNQTTLSNFVYTRRPQMKH